MTGPVIPLRCSSRAETLAVVLPLSMTHVASGRLVVFRFETEACRRNYLVEERRALR